MAPSVGCVRCGNDIANTPAVAQQQKPNVVFILADNVGYGDLGHYGGGELRGAPTPRIDQLAREGLRLTQFLVEPACTPSRAALMTGQYSIRNDLSPIAIEGSPYTLPARAFTMGELFKGAGYATAILGKWHLVAHRRACRPRTASTSSMVSRRTFRGMRQRTSTRHLSDGADDGCPASGDAKPTLNENFQKAPVRRGFLRLAEHRGHLSLLRQSTASLGSTWDPNSGELV